MFAFNPFCASSRSVLVAGLFAAQACAAVYAADVSALRRLDYSGDQRALESLDRDIAAAGTDIPKLDVLAAQLLGELKQPNLSFAARQAIAQRISIVLALSPKGPTGESLAIFRKMLIAERDVDVARLALDRVPAESIDSLVLEVLKRSEGRVRIALLQSVAVRRIARAVADVKPLLADSNPATAAAAAYALGAIGTADSLAALRTAPNPIAPGIVAAMLEIAPRMPGAEASALLQSLLKDGRIEAGLRAAALRLSLDAEPARATARISETLSGTEWPLKEAAIEAIGASTAPALVAELSSRLSSWDPPTQVGVIAALGRKADAKAAPAITAALSHSSGEVRATAITALGFLPGTAATVKALVPLAAGNNAEDAKLARQTLARLKGSDVDPAILDGAQHAPSSTRAVFIEQIAARNITEALPVLRQSRQSEDPAVRAAAVAALGDIGAPADQTLLIEWATRATDSGEQSRALRALVTLTQRNPDVATRSQPVIAAIEQAPPAIAANVVPVLARLGDRASAEALARLALKDDATLASAATATLTRWADRTALPALGTVAEKASLLANRKTAQQAALRLLERDREPWSPESTKVVQQLVSGIQDPKIRAQLVRMLGRAKDDAALGFAQSLAADDSVGAIAKQAVLIIQANRAADPVFRASGGTAQLNALTDGKTATRWSVPCDADQWLEIDFQNTRPVSQITMDHFGRNGEFPEHYEVHVTDNPQQPGPVVVSGNGRTGQTVIDFPNGTHGRYVLIKNTADRVEGRWTVAELVIE